MVENEKKPTEPKETEEYKFTEEEFLGDYGAETEEPEPTEAERPPVPFYLYRKILIVIFIIAIVFVFYQFFRPEHRGAAAEEAAEVAAPQALNAGQVAVINQQLQDTSAKHNTLAEQVNQLQAAMARSNQTLNDLTIVVAKLIKEVDELKEHTKMTKVEKGETKMIYHVRAIVAGRAWLEAPDGTIITVRLGTELGRYGKITKIDSEKGIVKTNLGYVIQYGKYDI